MSEQYDVVIIGGGPGGYNCAIRAGQLGLKVACVEMRGKLGGTCLNVGCIPSKALLHASELFEAAKTDFAGLGIKTGGVELDLPQMMQQKDEAVDGLTKGIEFLFGKNKVDYIRGKGRIKAKGEVEVEAEDGTSVLKTTHIVIATGSEVTPLPGVEIDEKRVVSSTGALSLDTVPGKLVLIGAGVIGLELGSVMLCKMTSSIASMLPVAHPMTELQLVLKHLLELGILRATAFGGTCSVRNIWMMSLAMWAWCTPRLTKRCWASLELTGTGCMSVG